MFLVAFAIIFVVVIFLAKTTSIFDGKEKYQSLQQQNGLAYDNTTLRDLVNQDTDEDGILDWEEKLWGTDPTKKETTSGISDVSVVEKIKSEKTKDEAKTRPDVAEKDLTETEKFSRELFSTVVSLDQSGNLDQATIDTLSSSLSDKINNPVHRKVFTLSNIKVINDDSVQSIKNYSDKLNEIYKKYSTGKGVPEIINELVNDEENMSILGELDPVIEDVTKVISESANIGVPQSLYILHLNLINSAESVLENIQDMKLFDKDVIVAIGAISQYGKNTTTMQADAKKLTEAISKKLNN